MTQGKVKEWISSTFGQNKAKKRALEGRLEALDRLEGTNSWAQSMSEERRKLKEEWQRLNFEEERSNWLKSKCKWAKEGDANSRFFHNLLNARKARNVISRIEREDGSIIDKEDEIVEELIGFFFRNFMPLRQEGEEEVKRIVFSCEGSKVSGPDGFRMAVFKNNWDTIKDDLMEVFRAFEKEGRIEGSINETFICLIPKILNSCKVKDFRPISLITSVYKIVAKTLATRLRGVLGETISETQLAFVEGRQILDSVLIANETVEEYRSRGKKGFVFKIDLEKAYDCVDWDFLDLVLKEKGFGELWRKWIRGCVSSTLFSLLINGRARGKFRGKDNVQISHLQFADDTLFFVKDEASLRKLVEIVETFCGVSSLKVNLNKSQLLGICLEEEVVAQNTEVIGCKVGTWPMTYLGMPLGGSPRKDIFWEPVLDKCAKRLDGWKCSFLSRGGRLTLIQSVLSSLPIYYLSLFKAPKIVIKAIEKMMRDFFWEGGDLAGGDHLVAWDEEQFPDVAVISKAKNVSTHEMIADEGEVGNYVASWDFKFRRNFMDREISNLTQLLQKLEHVRVLNILDDSRLWIPDPSGIFSSKQHSTGFLRPRSLVRCFGRRLYGKAEDLLKLKCSGGWCL
uniref:Reverse transcriptase domain-containing protein n=1 Tax=Cannabis sativa TaxID=3483 RepID=A0A803PZS1_CANSA